MSRTDVGTDFTPAAFARNFRFSSLVSQTIQWARNDTSSAASAFSREHDVG
jgi:hypothetical protein